MSYVNWAIENRLDWVRTVDLEKSDAQFLWIDVETTGLNNKTDVILEIGGVLTDEHGAVCAEPFGWLVYDVEDETRYWKAINAAKQNPIVAPMHEASGLWNDWGNHETAFTYRGIQRSLMQYLRNNTEDPSKILLAGSSVHFDRYFMLEFPELAEVVNSIHYRTIDNSTIKELCRKLNPRVYEQLDNETEPKKLHRVLPDLVDSIKEYTFYVDNFLYH